MKFQLEQKGLFTFYKEQQLFQQEIQKNKRDKKEKADTDRKIESTTRTKERTETKAQPKTKKDTGSVSKLDKVDLMQKTQSAIKFKKYGDAVIIINRKQTQQGRSNQIKYENSCMSSSKEQGYFIENKKIEFDSPLKEGLKDTRERQTHNRRKILFLKKREDSVISNKRYEKEEQRSSRLPTITRGESTKNSPNPDAYRNRINGSLLRSNGSDLLRQIRSNALQDSGPKKEQVKRSVSYIEYNNDYCYDTQFRKKDKLSLQQRKLLQILSHYRRSDF